MTDHTVTIGPHRLYLGDANVIRPTLGWMDAAPELLEALQNLVNSFEKHRPKEYWDAARAAIAKATGA